MPEKSAAFIDAPQTKNAVGFYQRLRCQIFNSAVKADLHNDPKKVLVLLKLRSNGMNTAGIACCLTSVSTLHGSVSAWAVHEIFRPDPDITYMYLILT